DHAGAQVVDHPEERQLGDESAGLFRNRRAGLLPHARDVMLADLGVSENQSDAQHYGHDEKRLVRENRLPAEMLLEVFGEAAEKRSERAEDRADEGVQREDPVAVFRGALFGEQRLLDRIERTAALAAAAGAARADVGHDDGDEDKDELAGKNVDRVRDDRERGQKHENFPAPVAVGKIAP